MIATINLEGVELEARFSFTPGCPARLSGHPDTWEPAELDEFELEAVFAGGQDITSLIADNYLAEIENKCLEHYKAVLEDARVDRMVDAYKNRIIWGVE